MPDGETLTAAAAAPRAPASHLRPLIALIPSCTDAFLDALLSSMERMELGSSGFAVVGDNGITVSIREKWDSEGQRATPRFVPVPKPFVFSKAINVMAQEASRLWPGCDLLVLNDDTEMVSPNWLARARTSLAELRGQPFGMLAFEIDGGVGNDEQKYRPGRPLWTEAFRTVCFVAVIVTRECWERVGLLDERFSGYGFDDDDYCRRVRQSELRCGILGGFVVKHGAAGFPHSSSYARILGQQEWNRQFQLNAKIFKAKWGAASVQNRRCLNLGCGNRARPSEGLEQWINIDVKAGPDVDVVRDLRRGIPFGDGTFDYILCDNVLEHFVADDVVFLINEMDRVLKVGGVVEIIVPHYQSQGAVQDPTHKSLFVPRSFMYWNQKMTPCGGQFVGITANLLAANRDDVAVYALGPGGVELEPDFVNQPEIFIRWRLTKMPLTAVPKD